VLERLLRAGVDVVRLNFSHGTAQDHIARANLVREVAAKVGKPVALMADLQGPKIRVGKFAEGKVMLQPGAAFVLDAQRSEPGDVNGSASTTRELPRDVQARRHAAAQRRPDRHGGGGAATRCTPRWSSAACCPTTRASTRPAAG
jgi:pyruvate kinase